MKSEENDINEYSNLLIYSGIYNLIFGIVYFFMKEEITIKIIIHSGIFNILVGFLVILIIKFFIKNTGVRDEK